MYNYKLFDIILFTAREVDTQVKVLSESIRGSVYVVSPGKCYRKLSEQRYEINTVRLEDYVSLLDDLKDAVKGTTGIIHNWTSDVVDLEKQLELGIYSLFMLSKSLVSQKYSCRIVYNYTLDQSGSNPIGGMVGGFIKSFHQEQSRVVCKVVGFSSGVSLIDQSKSTLAELFDLRGRELEVKYEGADRYLISYKPKDVLQGVEGNLLKKGGVYIITGGLGGLGKIFTSYLLREYDARVILVGRSELTDAKKLELVELEKEGGVLSYYRGDVGDLDEVKSIVGRVKSSYGSIDGIIHAAGILRDSLLVNKSEEDFRSVLRPKVSGVMNLDKLLYQELYLNLAFQLASLYKLPGAFPFAYPHLSKEAN